MQCCHSIQLRDNLLLFKQYNTYTRTKEKEKEIIISNSLFFKKINYKEFDLFDIKYENYKIDLCRRRKLQKQ